MRGVDVNGEEPRYEPAKTKDGINPHVFWSTGIYVAASASFGAIWLLMMYWLFGVVPEDPDLQLRYLALKGTAILVCLSIFFGAMQVLEWLTNGNGLGRILQNALATAVFYGVVLYCVSQLIQHGYE